ncbi:hypothetical protein PIIN_04698 [Serendipita indica DSM 11827]|uniref:F-box domain-containing protein n=1 Tax=Serendipita indica (strain DSM 11827) TaxID=1109443 RepID=G4THH0_SERID|nr:hypothetical protein PIIN_04698 [Serendipita indica DSM 11827]
MSSPKIKLTNRVPAPRERAEIQRVIKRDEEELARLIKDLELVEKQITTQGEIIHNYKEALTMADSMRRVTERARKTMAGNGNILAVHSANTSVRVSCDETSYQKYEDIYKEINAIRKIAIEEAQKATNKIAQLDASIRGTKRDLESEESLLEVYEFSKQDISVMIARLQEGIAIKKNLASARRIVPVEVWEYIFLLCVSEEEALFGDNQRNGRPPFTALKLSGVCRQWRDIVTGQPKLWQCIAIPHHDKISTGQRGRISYYRAQCSPLLPKVYTYTHNVLVGSFTVDLVDFMLDTFSKYSELDLLARPFSVMRGPNHMQVLERLVPRTDVLKLTGYCEWRRPCPAANLDFLQNTKHLIVIGQNMDLRGISNSAENLTLTSLNLTEVAMQTEIFPGWLQPLKKLRYVEMFKVTFTPAAVVDTIEMPAMEHLLCDFSIYSFISRSMNAPRLKQLDLITANIEELHAHDWDTKLGTNFHKKCSDPHHSPHVNTNTRV